LFLESRRVPSVRLCAAFVDLQQLVPSDDAGVGFPHPCARHEQLRERVGDAPALARFHARSSHMPQILHPSGFSGGADDEVHSVPVDVAGATGGP
jgi:hypothetical protein